MKFIILSIPIFLGTAAKLTLAFSTTSKLLTAIPRKVIPPSHRKQIRQSNSSSSSSLSFSNKKCKLLSLLSSQSDEFIDALLSQPKPDDKYTHQIAIPLEQNHNLLLELESIQKGILYHCPLLINACISGVLLRLPLLYVDTTTTTTPPSTSSSSSSFGNVFSKTRNNGTTTIGQSLNSSSENDILTSRDPITQSLHAIVQNVVQKYIYQNNNNDNEQRQQPQTPNTISLSFQGLEIDGDQNEILHTIAKENESTKVLRSIIYEIQHEIETQHGWKTILPPDFPQGGGQLSADIEAVGDDDNDELKNQYWRGRLPFMRLPSNFVETLPNPKGLDGKWEEYTEKEKENYVRFPEEGGNGISPIFWYKWWDDVLCNGEGVRMREIAVYGRTGPFGLTERSFYIPHLRTKLPDGDDNIQRKEEKAAKFDTYRRMEQIRQMEEEDEVQGGGGLNNNVFSSGVDQNSLNDDFNDMKFDADRRMIETIYDLSPDEKNNKYTNFVDDVFMDTPVSKETTSSATNKDSSNTIPTGQPPPSSSERTKEIIKSIEKSTLTGKSNQSELAKKKPKLSPKDNPIFQNWRERITKAEELKKKETKENKNKHPLPPFPSNEHFVGIWRFMSTPHGPSLDEQRLVGVLGLDPSTSENLVLRVDGTTAGGPILDFENGHRAAGGTWKFFEAEWIGGNNNNNESMDDDDNDDKSVEKDIQTRMRIRLLVPPTKDKVLVMEGIVKRGVVSSAVSVSNDNMDELRIPSSLLRNVSMNAATTSTSDRITTNEEASEEEEEDKDVLLYCAGEVWMEDATIIGKGDRKKRTKIGKFSMMKLVERDPNELQYTIPAPRRYQD